MEKPKISSCLVGVVLGAIVGLLSGMAFASGWFATGTLLVITFFGYFLGAILENRSIFGFGTSAGVDRDPKNPLLCFFA